MSRFLILDGAVVANVVEATADFAHEQGWQPAGDAQIGWVKVGATFSPPPAQEKTPQQLRDEAKAARAIAVGAITVTTQAGNVFDGDETSQGRMARAVIVLQATNTPSVVWVLHDNTIIEASVAELTEALALSGAAQAALWVL